jgi:hypothetical protein
MPVAPTAVIAGHKIPDGDDSPRHIGATRRYIQDFDRVNEETETADELYERMRSTVACPAFLFSWSSDDDILDCQREHVTF